MPKCDTPAKHITPLSPWRGVGGEATFTPFPFYNVPAVTPFTSLSGIERASFIAMIAAIFIERDLHIRFNEGAFVR